MANYHKKRGTKMKSLLGQFYNRIKGSQEDVASESLAYILKNSLRARQAINNIIKVHTGLIFTDLKYKTQKVGTNLERPDITGINEDGKVNLLIEAKFWASLTANQPNTYLQNLPDSSVLIFLVPTLRIRSIFAEVLARVKNGFPDLEVDTENLIIKINPTNKCILIKSWDEILRTIKSELIQENNTGLISDIDQIIGFCNIIDNNSFQPIVDLDLSPSIPKKITAYYDIVDKVVDEITNRIYQASTQGLQRSPQKYGYQRYFTIGDIGFGMSLKMELWAEYADTPFWLSIAETKKSWKSSDRFLRNCEKVASLQNRKLVEIDNVSFLSLKPLLNETEDNVINDLATQVELILKECDQLNKIT